LSSRHFGGSIPKERRGKFVILASDAGECMVMAPREFAAFHANIVEAFLMDQGRPGRFNAKRDYYYTEGTGWEVLGGGKWNISANDSILALGGTSLAYGDFPEHGIVDKIQLSGAFPGYKVRVNL